MATKGKESPPTKEKRGNSPSYNARRKSPSTSKQGSPIKRPESSSSTPSPNKQIPNYLKPTISSGGDHSNSFHHNTTNKSTALYRRRSFDNPLPPHAQTTRVSPGPPGERNLRSSSSFTAKSTTSKKSFPPERLAKTTKDAGKEHSLYARSACPKKTTTKNIYVKKQGNDQKNINDLATKEPITDPEHIHVGYIPVLETQHQDEEDLGSPITEADEEVLNIGKNSEKATEDLIMEDHEQQILEPITATSESGTNINQVVESKIIIESSISDDKDIYEGMINDKIEKLEENLAIGASSKNQPQSSSTVEKAEMDQDHPNESDHHAGNSEAKADKIDEEKKGPDGGKKDSREQELDEENQNDAKEEKQFDEQENVTEAPKLQQQKGTEAGKNDNSSVSNDVIEETASKLREQRKNKVKALAGAFETVISLQEPK